METNSLSVEATEVTESPEVSETLSQEAVEAANNAQDNNDQDSSVEKEAEVDQDDSSSEDTEKKYSKDDINRMFKERDQKRDRSGDKKLQQMQARLDDLDKAKEEAKEIKATDSESGEESPVRADYETYEDYLEARSDYRADQKVSAKLKAYDEQRAKESEAGKKKSAEQKFQEQANQRIEEGRKEFKDFDTAINLAVEDEIINVGSELYIGVCDSPVGHRIAYYLAKPANHAEAERINSLSPRGVQREIGKLEVKFAVAETGNKTQARSDNAMEPLGGGRPSSSKDVMSDKMSTQDFINARNAAQDKLRG